MAQIRARVDGAPVVAAAGLPLNLLATKLFVPPVRADLVLRNRLFNRLKHAVQGN